MCGGASRQQKDIEAKQAAFYDEMTASYKTVFGKAQGLLDSLTATYKPILEAGPNQRGFSAGQRADLETTNKESVATNYGNAKRALEEGMAGRGGGDAYLPSGVDEQIRANLAEAGARRESAGDLQIDQADYEAGHQNFLTATNAIAEAAGLQNPTGYAGGANTAGSSAASTADAITQANNAWMGPVFGAIGGIGGGLASNPKLFGGGK